MRTNRWLTTLVCGFMADLSEAVTAVSPQSEQHTHGSLRRWVRPTQAARRGLVVVVWLACIGAFAVLVLMMLEDTPLQSASSRALSVAYIAFMCRTFALHGALAALFFAVLAFSLRQRVAGSALVVLSASFSAPYVALLVGRESIDAQSPPSREVRILSMNVLLTNVDPQPALAFIREHEPDVVMVQEHTPAWHKALTASLAQDYPFVVNEMRNDAFGQAIFSRHPFAEPPVLRLSERTQAASARVTGAQGLHDPQIRVVLDIDGQHLVLQNVHTVPPADKALFYEQRVQFSEFIDLARTETRPLLMAGDFNATSNSRHIQHLLAAGMRDANAIAGTGLGNTWPDLGPLRYLPRIRIDHTLVNARVSVRRHILGPSIGSDHRPLLTCITMQ